MASFGARDRFLRAAPQRLDRALEALGIEHDIKVYPDAGHAFLSRSEDEPGMVAGTLAQVTHAGYHEASARDLSRSAVIHVLLELRSLPNRLQRALKGRPTEAARPPLTLKDMERAGFLLLGESPGHEIVFGSVVQPWKAVTDDQPAPQVEAGRFAAFDTPGYVKVAFNIRVEPYGSGRALITTETRTAATDPRASAASPATGCSLARSAS